MLESAVQLKDDAEGRIEEAYSPVRGREDESDPKEESRTPSRSPSPLVRTQYGNYLPKHMLETAAYTTHEMNLDPQ